MKIQRVLAALGFGFIALAQADGIGELDFSQCGYNRNRTPVVSAVCKVEPITGDATALIQQTINHVSALSSDANGFRGAVLLGKGTSLFRMMSPDRPGQYTVNFDYTNGAHALLIEKAELRMNGSVVATDEHRGQTGAFDAKNTYDLTIPTYAADAEYVLRALVAGSGGGHTYGIVHWRFAGASERGG